MISTILPIPFTPMENFNFKITQSKAKMLKISKESLDTLFSAFSKAIWGLILNMLHWHRTI